MIEVELPDGNIAEFPDGTPAEVMQTALAKYRDPKKALEADVRKNDAFWGRGGKFERFTEMVTDPIGIFDEMSGAGAYLRGLVTDEDAAAAYTEAAERKRAERRVAREDNGWLGTGAEILGGLATAGPVKAVGPALSAWQTALAASKAGAAGGAVAGTAQAEGGIGDRIAGGVEGGLIGGVAGPILSNIVVPGAARLWGKGKDAVEYARRALHGARNPEEAAVNAVADQAVESGLDFGKVRAQIQPPTSRNLQSRGFTDADLADVISRQMQGESADSVAATYAHLVDAQGRAPTGATMRKYLQRYQEQNPTPVNMADMAVEQLGYQGAMPILRRARANYGIAPDATIAQTLENRQVAQPGRVSDMLQQSKAVTPEGDELGLDDHIRYLTTEAKKHEREAYAEVRRQKADIDVSGVVREARKRAAGRQGEIGETMNKAVDLFFEPELRAGARSPMSMLRLREAREKLARMQSDGTDYERMARQRRLVRTMEQQEDWTNPLKQVKVGTPIKDVQRFIDARDELSQMVKRSMQDGQDTPLTAELTRLRTELNTAARSTNPALTAADARFHDDRTVERLIEEGQKLGVSLNPRSREAMRDFETLTGTQQEVVRTAFEQNLSNLALNVTDGNAAARRFQSKGFRELVEGFYPESAGKAVYERGQDMIRRLKRESVTTNTGNFITNRNNSPTAFLTSDMDEAMQLPRAASDLATGRFGRLMENLSDRLAKQIGAQAAAAQLKIVAETDPAKLLQLLNRLEPAAKQSAQRRQFVTSLRSQRALNRPGVAFGAGVSAEEIGE